MTVSELISILQKMDGTNLVVIGHPMPGQEMFPASPDVFEIVEKFYGEDHNCTVIEPDVDALDNDD